MIFLPRVKSEEEYFKRQAEIEREYRRKLAELQGDRRAKHKRNYWDHWSWDKIEDER